MADLVELIPVVAAAYGAVLGAVALAIGWRVFSHQRPVKKQRGVVTPPPVGVIERNGEDAR